MLRRLATGAGASLPLILVVFGMTRACMVYLALNQDVYPGGAVDADVAGLYSRWAHEIIEQGRVPYADIAIEYLPGVLPFVVLPYLAASGSYVGAFVAQMLVLDVITFWLLLGIDRQWESRRGAWMWAVAIPALGPIAFLRLDMPVAAAVVAGAWAASRGKKVVATSFVSAGGMLKAYPFAIVPFILVHAKRRGLAAAAATGVALLIAAPFIGAHAAIWDHVVRYHAGRGIQIESTWGAALLMGARHGVEVDGSTAAGAFHLQGPGVSRMKKVSAVAAVAVVGLAAGTAVKRRDRGDRAAWQAVHAMTALLLAAATVLSPQFIMWAIATGAVAASASSHRHTSAWLLIPIALLTQLIFPILYPALLRAETGALVVLWMRNLLLVAAGVAMLVDLRGEPVASGANEPFRSHELRT